MIIQSFQNAIPIDNPYHFYNEQELLTILSLASDKGVSDITFQTEEPVVFQYHGKVVKVGGHKIANAEIEVFLERLFNSPTAIAVLNGGKSLDGAFSFQGKAGRDYRFRINASKILTHGTTGYQITLRDIPNNIPFLSDMGLDEDLKDALLNLNKGVAFITGATGSGKSTLLASIIGEFLRNDKFSKKILTAEEPVEFVYDSIKSKHSIIAQSQIPEDMPSFADSLKSALRRSPNIILIGEGRDKETIEGIVHASKTGHEVYTTVHSNGFIETFGRLLDVFEGNQKATALSGIVQATSVVLSQTLVPKVDGGRVALREWVILDENIKMKILRGGVENLPIVCKDILKERGVSFGEYAQRLHKLGLISDFTLELYQKR